MLYFAESTYKRYLLKQYTAFDDSSASHSDTDKSPEKDGGAETQQPKGGEDK